MSLSAWASTSTWTRRSAASASASSSLSSSRASFLEAPRLLILDEPNSALNDRETERLFAVLRQLRERGVTMLYVSHRLEEVFAISDRVTIARNGKDVTTRDRAGLTMPEVIDGMIGAHPDEMFPPPLPSRTARQAGRAHRAEASPAANSETSSSPPAPARWWASPGSKARASRALLNILFGAHKARSGDVIYPDGRGLPRSATEAARRGVCLVPADRRRNGLMLDRSILFNISQVVIGALNTSPLFSLPEARRRASRQIAQLRIKTRSPDTSVDHLSGGNQQKVVIGKWLEIGPRVVLLDDPTRGVDVGAKREIYELIRGMSADGRIILFSSTELPELIGLCDRILVFYRGRLAGEVAGSGVDSHSLLHLINTGERPPQTRGALQ